MFGASTWRIGAAMSLVAVATGVINRPPIPYIDKGACPFEGCTYRTWITKKEVHLVRRPDSRKTVGVIQVGERVIGITGEVHSIPILVHAAEDIPDPNKPDQVLIPRGKPFYVIHHLGEGYWLCWYNGRLTEVENFSDTGPFPKATWWVEVRTSSGLIGWTISDDNFDGQDSLA